MINLHLYAWTFFVTDNMNTKEILVLRLHSHSKLDLYFSLPILTDHSMYTACSYGPVMLISSAPICIFALL